MKGTSSRHSLSSFKLEKALSILCIQKVIRLKDAAKSNASIKDGRQCNFLSSVDAGVVGIERQTQVFWR